MAGFSVHRHFAQRGFSRIWRSCAAACSYQNTSCSWDRKTT
ncbi:MAG: hypothetical protein ACK56F_05025 [bacterium]